MGTAVVVCRKCKRHECVVDFLSRHTKATIDLERCQKVCEGPVVGVEIAGRMEWFERVSKAKALAGLAKVVAHPERAEVPGALAKRRVRKLSGRAARR